MNTRLLKINKITALHYARFHLPMIRVHIIDIELFASIVGPSLHMYVATRVQIVRGMSEANDG